MYDSLVFIQNWHIYDISESLRSRHRAWLHRRSAAVGREVIDVELVRRLLTYTGRYTDHVVAGLSGENAQDIPDT